MPTALIVEDEPEANKLLGMLLQLRGYKTVAAYTGEQALASVRNSSPDIVFLDLMLPDINGYEICKTLKSSKPTSLIPLVIVTARIASENRVESFCIGADEYVPKPYTPDQIYQALDRAISWRNQVDHDRILGSVDLDGRDDVEALRRLTQLRSLVLARSSLDLDSVTTLIRAIKEVWCLAADSTADRDVERGTKLSYDLSDERLILTFSDRDGWLQKLPSYLATTPLSSLSDGQFDQVVTDPLSRSLTMVARLTTV